MSEGTKTRVFRTGRSQAVRVPAQFRFTSDEVYVRRDPQSGDLIFSETSSEWNDVFAALDHAGVPDDFLEDRSQGVPQKRKESLV